MNISSDVARRVRIARGLAACVLAALFCSSVSFAINTTYTCSDQQRLMIENARGAAGASCIAKPYQLVCTDDGQYGCCKSECECIFRGRLFADKGWGGGARNFTSYSISNSCPVVKDPVFNIPGANQVTPTRTPPKPPQK